MKNYFDFLFSGKKFFPYWFVFYVAIMAIMVIFQVSMKKPPVHTALLATLLMVVVVTLITLLFYYFYLKMVIDATRLKDENFVFKGTFVRFLSKAFSGLVLTILTVGIYYPWFKATMARFFVNKTSYQDKPFEFQPNGTSLFVILLITSLPLFLLFYILSFIPGGTVGERSAWATFGIQVLTYFLIIPMIYSVYNWFMNFDYDNLNIHWETDLWESMGKIALELFFTVITLGIYFPMMYIKLYHYFVGHTVAENELKKYNFGYDIEQKDDFLYFWGQTLLFIVTLGFYYPWMVQKLGRRFISKTYVEKVETTEDEAEVSD